MAWDVMVNIPQMFQDSSCEVEIPHTASVKVCTHPNPHGIRQKGIIASLLYCRHVTVAGRDVLKDVGCVIKKDM